MFFRKKQPKKESLNDFVEMKNYTGYIFININNDLGDAVENGTDDWSPLMLMAYAYARRAAAAALYIQGIVEDEMYEHVKTIFKGIQIKTGHTVEFQEKAFDASMEFMKGYSPVITKFSIKKIVQIAEEYEFTTEQLTDSELFENVIEAAHLEQKDVLSNNWINNLIKWAKDNNLPERKAVEGMWGDHEYVGFPSDQESISFLSSFNRFTRGSIYEANKSLEINLNNHNISMLPIEFFQLVGIHVLYLHANNLEVLPEEIGNLVNLYSLDLGKNNLKHIPKSICNLKNLEYLNLHGNNLSELPVEIVNLYNLNQINLSGNDNLKLTAEQKNWIQSFDEDDIWIDDDLFDRGSANIQNVKMQESEVTSPFEPKPELQSEQGVRNYLARLSSFEHSTLCVEFANVRAAKHNLMLAPTGLNDFQEVQTLVTDLTDKSVTICIFVFGQPAVFGYNGGDLRSFNELVNEIDDRVANLNLEPEQHGGQLLKSLGEHLQAGSYDDVPF